MNIEKMLATVSEARSLAEGAEESLNQHYYPTVGQVSEAFVCAKGAAEILNELERDLRSELLTGRES